MVDENNDEFDHNEEHSKVTHRDKVSGKNADKTQKNREDNVNSDCDPNQGSGNILIPGEINTDLYSKEYSLEHPAYPETLSQTWYLQYALREANLDGEENSGTVQRVENNLETEFLKTILDYAPNAIEASGLKFPADSETQKEIFEGLVLQIRKCSPTRLREYKKSIDFANIVKSQRPLSSTLDSTEIDREPAIYEEGDYWDRIDEAALRIVYALYRTGEVFPQQVRDNHLEDGDDRSPIVLEEKIESTEDGHIPSWMRKRAIENWIDYLLREDVLDVVSYERGDEIEFPDQSFLGLLAHSALQSTSVRDGSKTCGGWIVDSDLVPTGSALRNYINSNSDLNSLSISDIADRFDRANSELFKICDEYSMFNPEHRIAFDPTSILVDDRDDNDNWIKGYTEPLKGDVESSNSENSIQLEVGISAIIGEDLRLILGVYPINSDENMSQSDSLSRSSRPFVSPSITEHSIWVDSKVQVDKQVMDRGVHGADVIDKIRDLVDDDWIKLVASGIGEVDELVNNTPPEEPNFSQLEEYPSELSEKPNVLIVPRPQWVESGSYENHWAFLTDLSVEDLSATFLTYLSEEQLNDRLEGDVSEESEEDLGPRDIQNLYTNRRRIETTIKQIKHYFKIPTKNSKVELEFYYINIAMLFFNMYNIINISLAPESALPLPDDDQVSPGEVLSGIRKVAFQQAKEVRISNST